MNYYVVGQGRKRGDNNDALTNIVRAKSKMHLGTEGGNIPKDLVWSS